MPTNRRTFLRTTALATVGALAGCSAIPGGGGSSDGGGVPLDEIEVRLVDVRQPDVGLTSATIPILVGFENPTSTTISSIAGDLDVSIGRTRVASDDLAIARLEGGEEVIEELSVVVELADVGSSVAESIQAGTVAVRVEGELHADGRSEGFSVGEELQGES